MESSSRQQRVQIQRDVPLSSFKSLKVVKKSEDTKVEIVSYADSGTGEVYELVLKTFDKEMLLEKGNKID